MYVRKFEADSVEEALKEIKRELGPEAVILKTVTNKGIKGAFKKKKIEITAAITEKEYVNKAHVDRVLSAEQKEKFYSSDSSHVANMINQHAQNRDNTMSAGNGYGKMSLNRQVQTVKSANRLPEVEKSSALDEFLGGYVGSTEDFKESKKLVEPVVRKQRQQEERQIERQPERQPERVETQVREVRQNESRSNTNSSQSRNHHQDYASLDFENVQEELKKLFVLEKKVFDLTKKIEDLSRKEPTGLYHLRNSLKTLDISDAQILKLINKLNYALSAEELENQEMVFEVGLKEMIADLRVKEPMSYHVDVQKPLITLLISEYSSGASSMSIKMAVQRKRSLIVKFEDKDKKNQIAETLFGVEIRKVQSIPEAAAVCRKAIDEGYSVFVDYNRRNVEQDETKRFVDGLKRSFDNVEVIVSISAIHTETYNKKILRQFRSLANGMVISHLDLCLSYGSLYNIGSEFPDLPMMLFGTGRVIPEDVENASAERIMGGIFRF